MSLNERAGTSASVTTPMATEPSIIVLHNQVTPESPEDIADVLTQAKWIAETLEGLGHRVLMVPFSLDQLTALAKLRDSGPLVVLNMVDSGPGEENLVYLVPSLLDHLRIPYTGCSAEALFTTTDKLLTKRLLRSYGLPTADWVCSEEQQFSPGERYIIKARCEDASIGLDGGSVIRVDHLDELWQAITARERSTGKRFFAERYIEGREFNVELYGRSAEPIVLPPYEWLFAGFDERQMAKVFDYDAKWTEGTYQYDHVIARYHLPEEDKYLLQQLRALAIGCWNRFELSGYARIDMRVDQSGCPWILEINANPSFYGYYNVVKHHSLSFDAMLATIVGAATHRQSL